jgi:hypothetical protein
LRIDRRGRGQRANAAERDGECGRSGEPPHCWRPPARPARCPGLVHRLFLPDWNGREPM